MGELLADRAARPLPSFRSRRVPGEISLRVESAAVYAQKRALIVEKRNRQTSELSPWQRRGFGGGERAGDQKYQTSMAPTLTESGVKSSGTETKTSSKGMTLPPLE